MLDFERDLFRAKRAIVVAVILMLLLAGLLGVIFVLQGSFYSRVHEEPLVAGTPMADRFTIVTLTTPVKIEVKRTYPVDICLVDGDYYDEAATTADAFTWAIKKVESSTEFEFEGDLKIGEYVILMTHAQHDDIVEVKLTRLVLKPLFIFIAIFFGILILLLVLRIFLKIRRIGKIKEEMEAYKARESQKPPPSKFGWSRDRGPPHGEIPVYEASPRYQQTPSYSSADLAYFSGLDGSSSEGGGGDSKFLDFTPPSASDKKASPPRRESRGEISTGRPPRPPFRKKERYGFKEKAPEAKSASGAGKGRGRSGADQRGGSVGKEEGRGRSREAASKGRKEPKEEGYLDFDDFD